MKENIIASIIAVVIIGSFYFYINKDNTPTSSNFSMSNNLIEESDTKDVKEADEIVDNVNIVDGKQIIEIKAKGGFLPRKSIAKVGVPTILRLNTNGTFDCSSSVRIPSLKIFKNLPQTGTTDIDLGKQDVTVLHGTCGMGMYPFEIDFQK